MAETDVQDVAETMRRSGHLWMKIASKYAVEVVGTTSPKAAPTSSPAGSPAESPATKRLKALAAIPSSSSSFSPPVPDAGTELEAQRQKLVEVTSLLELFHVFSLEWMNMWGMRKIIYILCYSY